MFDLNQACYLIAFFAVLSFCLSISLYSSNQSCLHFTGEIHKHFSFFLSLFLSSLFRSRSLFLFPFFCLSIFFLSFILYIVFCPIFLSVCLSSFFSCEFLHYSFVSLSHDSTGVFSFTCEMCKACREVHTYISGLTGSSIGLGFFNPTSQLRRTYLH